jgi:hypothetical protein
MTRMYRPGRYSTYDPFKGEGRCPPSKPGLYRVKNDDKIMYIGLASNLGNRIGTHVSKAEKLKPGEKVEWIAGDSRNSFDKLREYEREKIQQHNPHRNKSDGGEGRRPKCMRE